MCTPCRILARRRGSVLTRKEEPGLWDLAKIAPPLLILSQASTHMGIGNTGYPALAAALGKFLLQPAMQAPSLGQVPLVPEGNHPGTHRALPQFLRLCGTGAPSFLRAMVQRSGHLALFGCTAEQDFRITGCSMLQETERKGVCGTCSACQGFFANCRYASRSGQLHRFLCLRAEIAMQVSRTTRHQGLLGTPRGPPETLPGPRE